MSSSGKLTSLGINAESALMSNSGFVINPLTQALQGTWIDGVYTQGNVTSSTVLEQITAALPNFLTNCVPAKLSVANWRNLLTIGSSVCPALGNSRPSSFIPTYAGYGTWENKTVDAYGNITGVGPQSLTADIYPPKNYGIEKTYSYIYQDHGEYAWITGWPGRNSWQKTSDDFSAAYPPTPSDTGLIDYDTYFSNGFIATIAQQAYYEFWYNYQTRRSNQYQEFVRMVQQCHQFKETNNSVIASLANSKIFLKGTFSNINDITTSDISGVNLAFKEFGNDLINLGKTLDLSQIHVFGLPSKLVLNLQAVDALTAALKFALLYSELSTAEVTDILNPSYIPDAVQEKKIYNALTLIQGQDLTEIQIIANCSTEGLVSLADLINPLKMFPNSYKSLTIPQWSTDTTSSKIYRLIYVGSDVNPEIQNWGEYLEGILPDDLALACGAFMMTMNQVKNIKQMDCEKFSQVVANLEVTGKDLPLINTTTGVPVDITLADQSQSRTAFGSGNSGIYRFSDFLGAMSGQPYKDYYTQIVTLINQLPTTDLGNVYKKLYQKSLGNDWELLSAGTTTNAYKLFVATAPAAVGSGSVSGTVDLTQVLASGDIITFLPTDSLTIPVANQYTVTGVTTTTVSFTPTLVVAVSSGDRIFKTNTNYNTTVPNLTTAATNAITSINAEYPNTVGLINYYWSSMGRQLAIEQRAIPLAVKKSENVYQDADTTDIDAFIRAMQTYALETGYCEISPIIEAISDITTVGGQSLIAMMRETRNGQRLINTGGELDNDIPDQLLPQNASAVPIIVDGRIVAVTVTSPGSNYTEGSECECCTPGVIVYPQGGVFGGSGSGAVLEAVMDPLGSVIGITVIDPGSGYDAANPPPIYIDPPPPPPRIGEALVPGSFAGSPYTGQNPVPDSLVTNQSASYTERIASRISWEEK